MEKTPLVLEDIIKVKSQSNVEDAKEVENSLTKANTLNTKNIAKNSITEAHVNEIALKIKVGKIDENSTIYFLDNTDGIFNENGQDVKHSHDNLKEMNESNTTLIIDGKEIPFKKYFIPTKSGIYSIRLRFNFKLSSCAYMFYRCENIVDIDFSDFNTQNITDMSYMFAYSTFTSLDLRSFKTENVMNMSYMFYKVSSLTSLNLDSFNTQNVTNMKSMFDGCSSLAILNYFHLKRKK